MGRLYRVEIRTEIMVRADSAEGAEQVALELDTMDWLDIAVSGQMDYHASEVRSVAARSVTESELEAAGQAVLFGGADAMRRVGGF